MAPPSLRGPPNESLGYNGYRVHTKDRIYRKNAYRNDGHTYYPVLIVGAGESGICMAHKLKCELGIDQFRIFDRQSGIGGTWWINRYPGVACDIPAPFYSFSFSPNPKWTVFYPPGPEIYDYLQDICDKFELNDKIQLNTDVASARWLESEDEWEVVLQHMVPGTGDLPTNERQKRVEEQGTYSVYSAQETVRCKFLISAVGGLVEPRSFPDVKGADTFKGETFHSARWDYNVDFKDKNVVVIGTGCSAAQFVPYLTKEPFHAKSVTQLMRTPPWVVPKLPTPGGEVFWHDYAPVFLSYIPGLLKTIRFAIFFGAELNFYALFPNNKFSKWAQDSQGQKMTARMRRLAPAKYHDILTPNYAIACKRRIYDATWYSSLNDPKVELTTMPLTGIQENSVTVGPGEHYAGPDQGLQQTSEQKTIPADIIVRANGFETHQWLHPLKVAGVHGQDLIQTMMDRGGSQAYQGTAMDGFPNFFMIFGPNTATGHSSVIMASENMVDYVANFIKLVLNGDASRVDVKQEAEETYTANIQRDLKKTVFHSGGCKSWYFSENGWNASVLPYSQIWFWYRCQYPKWRDWNISYTTKGLVKLILRRVFRVSAILAFILAYRKFQQFEKFRQNAGMSWSDIGGVAKMGILGAAILRLDKTKKKLIKMM